MINLTNSTSAIFITTLYVFAQKKLVNIYFYTTIN